MDDGCAFEVWPAEGSVSAVKGTVYQAITEYRRVERLMAQLRYRGYG